MRIIFVNQFFWPDMAATSQLLTDLVRHLGKEHSVTVVCSGGAYIQSESQETPPPVKIVRVPGFPYKRGVLARAISYFTFFVGALGYLLTTSRADMVVTMTTPPLLSVAGTITKLLRGTSHYTWEMDLFPDGLVTLCGFSERNVITRILRLIQEAVWHRADGILTLGPCMRARLLEHGIRPASVHVAENWANGSEIRATPLRSEGALNIFYSGNFGLAHDTATITSAIRKFKGDARFLFTFAGGGVFREQLEQLCAAEQLTNVRFLPYVTRDEMDAHLKRADLGLVTERTDHLGIVVPSKAYALMASGRPILFIGPRGSTIDLAIRQFDCGWQIDPGGDTALAELLQTLAADRDTVRRSGSRARRAFEEHYDLPRGVARVADALGVHVSCRQPSTEEAAINSR